MPRKFLSLLSCLVTFAGLGLATQASASSQEWRDQQGNSFKAEPVEVLGPFGLFRSGRAGGRMLPWRSLAPADCVRFHEQTAQKPARADEWTQARSVISQEIAGRVLRRQGDKLVEDGLKGRREPEFLILFFANHGVGKSWEMLGHSIEPYNKLQRAHPGLVEGLSFGMQHSASDHTDMALQMKLPWLVAEFHEQRRLSTIGELAPADPESYSVVVVNRDGVPIFSAVNPTDAELSKLFADLTDLLDLMRPGHPRSWPDRTHYLRAVQTMAFANGHADPILVGNPLVPEGLKKNGVLQVDATIGVTADGQVTEVSVKPDGNVSPKMLAALGAALKKSCVFVPAVDSGRFVAAIYNYHLEVPH
jgi:hypothetical protein